MSDDAYYHSRAVKQAQIHARWLMGDPARLTTDLSLPQAVRLIQDYVVNLDQPGLAVQLALHFHPHAERWSQWGVWTSALNIALSASQSCNLVLDEIRLLNCRSQAARELGDYETATAAATQALELAEVRGDRALMATSLNKLGVIAWKRDERDDASRYWQEAYALGQHLLRDLELGQITMNLGMAAANQGEFVVAQNHYDQARQSLERTKDHKMLAKLQCNNARLYHLQGKLDIALSLYLETNCAFSATSSAWDLAMILNSVGTIYLEMHQYNLALQYLQNSVDQFTQIGSLSGKVWALSNVVELYVTMEAWEQATPIIRQARELAIICDQPLTVANIDVDHGRMLAAQTDYGGARQIWDKALQVQQAQGALLLAHKTQQLLDELPQRWGT